MSQGPINNALIIGGTGMLAEASVFLSKRAKKTIIVARHATSFVKRKELENAVPLDLDYQNTAEFIESLTTQPGWEAIDAVLIWMHDSGDESFHQLLNLLQDKDCLIVHVLGSGSRDPRLKSDILDSRRKYNARYHTVVLGAIEEGGRWRWLSDQEISNGAIKALMEEIDVLVGMIRH